MGAGMKGGWLAGLLLGAAAVAAWGWFAPPVPLVDRIVARHCNCVGPLAVAQVTLASYRQEDKLLVHSETFTSRVVSRTALLSLPSWVPGWFLTGEKTFLIPATVGYAVPLAEMTDADLTWDATHAVLTVRRPRVIPQAPQPDMRAASVMIRGGLVILLRNAQETVDRALLAKGMAEVSAEAREKPAMDRAERDADIVLARLFERPLHAAGFRDAKVVVKRKD